MADRLRIARLVLRRGVASALRQTGLTLKAFLPRLPRGRPEAVSVAPQDLRTADPTVASEIYSGYFSLAGKVMAASGWARNWVSLYFSVRAMAASIAPSEIPTP